MAILNETLNKNYLSPLGFRLLLNKLPTTEYFVQSCSLPAVSSTPIVHPNPLTNMVRLPGDRVEFDQFSINFRVDEDMKNYTEIFDWITSNSNVDDQTKFEAASGRDGRIRDTGASIFSDGTLMVLNSNENATVRLDFKDLMPISLSTLEFDVQQTDIEYLQGTADFVYRQYTITQI
jgi:hypothetical protein